MGAKIVMISGSLSMIVYERFSQKGMSGFSRLKREHDVKSKESFHTHIPT